MTSIMMDPRHCGTLMITIYERTRREDRYELALTIEIVDGLRQCVVCGAKLTTVLEQPTTELAAPIEPHQFRSTDDGRCDFVSIDDVAGVATVCRRGATDPAHIDQI